jgi:hypothetical protein
LLAEVIGETPICVILFCALLLYAMLLSASLLRIALCAASLRVSQSQTLYHVEVRGKDLILVIRWTAEKCGE